MVAVLELEKEMKWFIADTHFNCPGLAEHRGFKSPDEHDDFVLNAINTHVKRPDMLYIIGDFAKNDANKYRSRIRCGNVVLIWGNHDRNSFASVFPSNYRHHTMKLTSGESVFLSHYPTAYWNKSHYGSFHLYGHCHGMREASLDALFPGRRSMDVGYEPLRDRFGQYRPINEEEVVEILGVRPGHDPVEWYGTNFGTINRQGRTMEDSE